MSIEDILQRVVSARAEAWVRNTGRPMMLPYKPHLVMHMEHHAAASDGSHLVWLEYLYMARPGVPGSGRLTKSYWRELPPDEWAVARHRLATGNFDFAPWVDHIAKSVTRY